jgi:hypothetical protein
MMLEIPKVLSSEHLTALELHLDSPFTAINQAKE